MDLKKLVAQYLRESADNLEADTCGMNHIEILNLAHAIMHLEMNKTEASDFLGISTRTFDRKIESGELPKGVRQAGNKNLIWYKDELLTSISDK